MAMAMVFVCSLQDNELEYDHHFAMYWDQELEYGHTCFCWSYIGTILVLDWSYISPLLVL